MKIRYLLLTLLMVGILLCGVFLLATETMKVIYRSVAAPIVAPVPAAISAVETLPQEVPADTTITAPENPSPAAPPLAETAEAPVPPIAPAGSNPYNKLASAALSRSFAGRQATEWSTHVKGTVYRVNVPEAGEKMLFLTFNAYRQDYPELIALLEKHNVPSTLFLTGIWMRRNAEQAKRLGTRPGLFDLENHGNTNVALSVSGAVAYERKGTPSFAKAMEEVTEGALAIQRVTGTMPRYVRPYLNYTDNVVVEALATAGIKTIGATRIADGGGLFGSQKIKDQIINAPHGAILLLNINPAYPNILKGLQAALEEIDAQKLPVRFGRLSEHESYFEYLP
jgi:peptidoglycan/xylan/chitin deacetylase (PgdA/CDA1 family)